MQFAGKNIWLIGASEGIGRALAIKMAGEGANVAVSARSKDRLVSLVSEMPKGKHLAVAVDATKNESVLAGFEEIKSAWGHIDAVIYASGVYTPMSVKQMDLKACEQTLDVNFTGSMRLLNVILPHFLSRNAGSIVLVGSVAGFRGLPNSLAYGASKAAMIHMVETIKMDLADTNIDVHIVNPGFVKTRLTDKNEFKMPFIITAEKAADIILKGLKRDAFEIHFPKAFTMWFKLLKLLPSSLYCKIVSKITS
ncbi:MAG: SDR family NAD(P)-dependent oxidoreductase [Proteobacteria bacterium]|nr:SDR family NAD(P)-dependent oxidoreductase [Pseudomonadota bacterium]